MKRGSELKTITSELRQYRPLDNGTLDFFKANQDTK